MAARGRQRQARKNKDYQGSHRRLRGRKTMGIQHQRRAVERQFEEGRDGK